MTQLPIPRDTAGRHNVILIPVIPLAGIYEATELVSAVAPGAKLLWMQRDPPGVLFVHANMDEEMVLRKQSWVDASEEAALKAMALQFDIELAMPPLVT